MTSTINNSSSLILTLVKSMEFQLFTHIDPLNVNQLQISELPKTMSRLINEDLMPVAVKNKFSVALSDLSEDPISF